MLAPHGVRALKRAAVVCVPRVQVLHTPRDQRTKTWCGVGQCVVFGLPHGGLPHGDLLTSPQTPGEQDSLSGLAATLLVLMAVLTEEELRVRVR